MIDAAPLDVACHLNVLVPDLEDPKLPAALDSLADLGYRRAVLPPLDPAAADARKLGRLFSRRGLGIITIAGQTAGADISSEDADVRRAGTEMLRRAAEFTADLGGDQMNGVPYGIFGHPRSRTTDEVFQRAAAETGAVADYAHQLGVAMTFEVLNRYETSVVNTAQEAMRFVDASGSEHLRIHLDTFHMVVEEADMEAAVLSALPKLGYLELGQSGRGRLGAGAVDVAGLLRTALGNGYRGRIGIEAFSRAVLLPEVGDMLAIWRSTYEEGLALAAEAIAIIDASRSVAGSSVLTPQRP